MEGGAGKLRREGRSVKLAKRIRWRTGNWRILEVS